MATRSANLLKSELFNIIYDLAYTLTGSLVLMFIVISLSKIRDRDWS